MAAAAAAVADAAGMFVCCMVRFIDRGFRVSLNFVLFHVAKLSKSECVMFLSMAICPRSQVNS